MKSIYYFHVLRSEVRAALLSQGQIERGMRKVEMFCLLVSLKCLGSANLTNSLAIFGRFVVLLFNSV